MLDEVTRSLVSYIDATTVAATGASWVVAGSLHADVKPAVDRLIVCLYAVEEHPHLRNQPLVRTGNEFVRPPLALRLSYVMAYMSNDELEVQARLALAIQALYTKPILGPAELRPSIRSLVSKVTTRMHNPPTDERNQIWTALGRSQRLALYYEADVALIEPLQHLGRRQVEQAEVYYEELTP